MHLRTGYADLLSGLCGDSHAIQTECIHSVEKYLTVREQLKQSSRQHITCGTHAAFKIECSH